MRNNLRWHRGGSRDGKPGYLLQFDYDEQVIAKLKAMVPAQLREWNPDTKEWWISEKVDLLIEKIFPGFFEAVRAQLPLPITDPGEVEKLKQLWG